MFWFLKPICAKLVILSDVKDPLVLTFELLGTKCEAFTVAIPNSPSSLSKEYLKFSIQTLINYVKTVF